MMPVGTIVSVSALSTERVYVKFGIVDYYERIVVLMAIVLLYSSPLDRVLRQPLGMVGFFVAPWNHLDWTNPRLTGALLSPSGHMRNAFALPPGLRSRSHSFIRIVIE